MELILSDRDSIGFSKLGRLVGRDVPTGVAR